MTPLFMYWTYTCTLSLLSSLLIISPPSCLRLLVSFVLLFLTLIMWRDIVVSLLGFLFQLRLCASRRISSPLFIFCLNKSKIKIQKSWQESLYVQASRRWNMSHFFIWRFIYSFWLYVKMKVLDFTKTETIILYFYSDNLFLRSHQSSFAY